MSFERLATVAASTKRSPALSGGKRGAPVANVTSLVCTPLDPVDAETAERLALDSAREVLQTFVDEGVDIIEGDILVVGSDEYPVRAVEDWTWRSTMYRRLILSETKR